MVFYVFYIWCLTVLMFRTRVRAVRSGEISLKFFRAYSGATPGERTVVVGRHYDNQFQVPVLFFAACIANIAMGEVGISTAVLAWLFVASRLFHSWVHLGSNNVRHRVMAFATGWFILMLMWLQLAYFAV